MAWSDSLSLDEARRQGRISDVIQQRVSQHIDTQVVGGNYLGEVEITEQAVLHDEEHGIAAPRERAARGIRITLDDHGIGFSSLQRLKRPPLHTLKIDRFFVTSLLSGSAYAAVVRSTIALCHELDITAVAEGVEVNETMGRLRGFGCDMVQGFGIGRPMHQQGLGNCLANRRFATP